MTIYGKEGLRELAVQNLSKAHYLGLKLKPHFSAPYFNEFVVSTNETTPGEINEKLLEKKIIGGLCLKKYYPELGNAMLLCATEMSKREHGCCLAEVFLDDSQSATALLRQGV